MSVKLSELILIHDQNKSSRSLIKNLGDGYLYNQNLIFRNIRNAALSSGYRFSHERFYDYDALALTQLNSIHKKKIIPYLNNVTPLKKIEAKVRNYFSLSHTPPLRANYLFHESAHAVAHQLLKIKLKSSVSNNQLEQERQLAIQILFEEAFANSCESLSNVYSSTEIHDEFLFKNSYIMESKKTRITLAKSIHSFGHEMVLKILFFSFLYANLLKTKSGLNDLDRVIKICMGTKNKDSKESTHKEKKLLAQLFKTGFDLDTEFTTFTNRFCLRLSGIETNLEELFDYDFLQFFEKNEKYTFCLNQLALTATAPRPVSLS